LKFCIFISDSNVPQRREDAAKGLKLMFLQAGVDWFYTHFTKEWYELVKDYGLQKFRMKALMTDYIYAVGKLCKLKMVFLFLQYLTF